MVLRLIIPFYELIGMFLYWIYSLWFWSNIKNSIKIQLERINNIKLIYK